MSQTVDEADKILFKRSVANLQAFTAFFKSEVFKEILISPE